MEKANGFKIIIPTVVVINTNNTGLSSENMAGEDLLCRSDNRERYKDCDDYNTDFCRRECEFGIKEVPVADIDFDNREDRK